MRNILHWTSLMLVICLIGCKSPFGSKNNLDPIATTPLPGVEDFDIHRYQVGDQQLTDQLYFFGFDRSDLRPEDKEALHHIAEVMIKHPALKVRIEGHTDDLGSSEYNIALAWRRAQVVGDYLESQGVSSTQIDMHSYGKENPLVIGTDDEARAKNRRAFLSFMGSAT